MHKAELLPIQVMPNVELRKTTHVMPFTQARKLIVFGSKTGREMVQDLLAKLDVEDAKKRIRKTFQLKYADAEELAERIETLFSGMEVSYKSNWYTSYRRRADVTKVDVVPDKRRNAISVITDSEMMEEIEELVREEDIPVDPGEVRPRVYELKYVDPGEIQQLLTDLFSAKEKQRRSFWDYYSGRTTTSIKPVGRLLGQFTFQVLGHRLIVNTKNAANYHVIDELISELDRPQTAGLPARVELKYANAEDLCEQLNAVLAEPGTLAKIQRAARGLSNYRQSDSNNKSANPSNAKSNQPDEAKPGEMVFWWQSFRRAQGQVPASNLVGKIRIVPVYRRNALMVLAPEGYKEPILELIEALDKPGRMVMIKARIGEILHDDQTTLGLRIASDPLFLRGGDAAIGGAAAAEFADAFFNGTLVLSGDATVSMLLNLLISEFDMKVLLEPSITTSDNEAAEYNDVRVVWVQAQSRQSEEGTSTVTELEEREVGTILRVRPHITKNNNVDLMVNLDVSRIVPGVTVQGNVVIDRREVTTHVIIKNGQTIMISGIIRQEYFDEVRKVPLLGDLWLIGKLFRSIDRGVRNRELVIFLTPTVMSTSEEIDAYMKKPLETLERIEQSMNEDNPTPRPDMPEETTR